MTNFRNEPYTDFSLPDARRAMRAALAEVRAQFGREYDLRIAGARLRTADKLQSVNPSNPSEIVGVHQRATPEMASSAVEAAAAYFPQWSRTSAAERIAMLRRVAQIVR